MPASKKKSSGELIPLRIVVVDPPPGILWALQLNQEEIVKATSTAEGRVTFDFSIEAVEDVSKGTFRLRGPAVQGPSGKKFVALSNSSG